MKKNTNKLNEKSISNIFVQMPVRNALYFVFVTLYLYKVLQFNLSAQTITTDLSPLLFLATSVVALVSCFMEMRIVDDKGNIVLPIARYFTFFGKIAVFFC